MGWSHLLYQDNLRQEQVVTHLQMLRPWRYCCPKQRVHQDSDGIYEPNIHPEELFLYFMTRMKTGNDHTYTNVWRHFRWEREALVTGMEMDIVLSWRTLQEYYWLDIRDCCVLWTTSPDSTMQSSKKCSNPMCMMKTNTTTPTRETSGLAFLPFDIFGFIDCSIDRSNRPFSGPAGDHEGAGRKPEFVGITTTIVRRWMNIIYSYWVEEEGITMVKKGWMGQEGIHDDDEGMDCGC